MNKRIIIGITSLVLIGTTVGAIMENHPKSQSSATEPVHKEITITQADVDAQITPEPTPSETPVATPKVSPKVTPQVSQAPVAPIVYKWADQMAAAGISESDYGYVTTMLLDDNGWRTTGTPLWQGNAVTVGIGNNAESIPPMLQRAVRWVAKYEGTWAVAYDRWNTAGNF